MNNCLSINVFRCLKGVGIALILFPFYRVPYIVQAVPFGETVVNAVTLVISVAAVGSMLMYFIRERHLPSFFGWILAFELTVAPFSFSVGFDASVATKHLATVLYQVAYCWLILLFIKDRDVLWIEAISKMFSLLIFLNFFSLILFPDGLYTAEGHLSISGSTETWLLGYDNAHAVTFIYGLMFSMLTSVRKTGKLVSIPTLILYLVCLVSTVLVWSATSVVSLVVFGAYIFLQGRAERNFVLTIRGYLVAYFILLCLLIVFSVGIADIPFISWFTESVLEKDSTFSQRSAIWENTLQWILSNPLFGNGAESTSIVEAKLGNPNGSHNEVLVIFYEGGLVHFAAFIGLLWNSARKIYANKELPVARAVSISILCMLLLQLMRGCSEVFWVSMYLVGFYSMEIQDILHSVKNRPMSNRE